MRDSHILVGFSLPLYPKDEAGKPTKMCELSHSFVGFFPTNMCEHFQLELRYLRTTVHTYARADAEGFGSYEELASANWEADYSNGQGRFV